MKTKKSLSSYQKPTILQVLPSLHSGGVERGTLEISSFLRQKGYNSIVTSAGGGMVSDLYQYGAKHINLPLATKNPLSLWKNIKLIHNLIKQHDIDVVHARSRAPAWSCYYAAKKLGVPFITTFHGNYGMQNPFKKFYNSIMTKGDIVIAVSNYIKDYIIENYPNIDQNKIRVVHRGVDTNFFNLNNIRKDKEYSWKKKLGIEENDFIILLPGRFSRWKGHEYCLDALSSLPENIPYKAIFLGDMKKNQNYVQELKNKVVNLHLSDKVIFAENTADIIHIYSLSDLVLSASTKPEAFGRTVIEAAALEKIVVATDIGGPAETVKNNETGFLISSQRSEELTSVIIKLYNMNPSIRKQMGIKAREYITENFSLEKMLEKTIAIYNEVGKFTN